MKRTLETVTKIRLSLVAAGLLTIFTLAPAPSSAIQLPTFSLRRSECTNVAGLQWHTDYASACNEAKCDKKLLLVNFVPTGKSTAQKDLDTYLRTNEAVRNELENYVLLRLPRDEQFGGLKIIQRKNRARLIDQPAFQHLGGSAGLAIIDYQHTKKPYFGQVVTALPFDSGKYYRWQNSHLAVALELPAGTVTQRTMVWAVRTHHERPQSTIGTLHPALAAAATKQSTYQARVGVQGHQNWETRFHQVVSSSHAGTASEVVAESWPNQDMIDSCIDCVKSWRHSSGHWGAVPQTPPPLRLRHPQRRQWHLVRHRHLCQLNSSCDGNSNTPFGPRPRRGFLFRTSTTANPVAPGCACWRRSGSSGCESCRSL